MCNFRLSKNDIKFRQRTREEVIKEEEQRSKKYDDREERNKKKEGKGMSYTWLRFLGF